MIIDIIFEAKTFLVNIEKYIDKIVYKTKGRIKRRAYKKERHLKDIIQKVLE